MKKLINTLTIIAFIIPLCEANIRTAHRWIQKDIDIKAGAVFHNSGYSTNFSSDGNTVAIVPNHYDEDEMHAHVKIYEWDGAGWAQKGKDIDGEAVVDGAGPSVSLSSDGNTVSVCAAGNDGIRTDAHVRVYEWNGTAWSQQRI